MANISSVLFFLPLLGSHYTYIILCVTVPQLLDVPFHFLQPFFSIIVSEDSTDISSSSLILSSAMSGLLMCPSKALFSSVSYFYHFFSIPSSSFHLSIHITDLLRVIHFSHQGPLHIITAVLNYWFDHPNVLTTPQSGSNARSVSSKCGCCLQFLPCHFLKAGYAVLVKATQYWFPTEIFIPTKKLGCSVSACCLSYLGDSSLFCDLNFLMDIRKVGDFQFVQLFPYCEDQSGDLQAPYVSDQKLQEFCFQYLHK